MAIGEEFLAEIFKGRRYRRAFIERCHTLISLGYERLDRVVYEAAQETDITGELVRAINEVLDDPNAPPWSRFFFVADDPPQNTRGRLGKRRLRVDIEFAESRRSPRARLHFEAKRLSRSNAVSEYLGTNGLGMFLSGAYAANEDEGGMLGYVQSGDTSEWIEKIGMELLNWQGVLGLCAEKQLRAIDFVPQLAQIHLSCHQRLTPSRQIHVFHTLLEFH
jgi:hypothetical protein